MYTLIRSIPTSRLLKEQLPAILISMICAEAFYKFHSFTLECLAFLATWFVVDALIGAIGKRIARKPSEAPAELTGTD